MTGVQDDEALTYSLTPFFRVSASLLDRVYLGPPLAPVYEDPIPGRARQGREDDILGSLILGNKAV